ncbi:hypothetical protein KAR34_11715, partial [bacterium]|nr:hypothetical protein [bacterium]
MNLFVRLKFKNRKTWILSLATIGWLLLTGSLQAAYAPAPPDTIVAWDPVTKEYVVRQAIAPEAEAVKQAGVQAASGVLSVFASAKPNQVRAISRYQVQNAKFRTDLCLGKGQKLKKGQRLYLEYTYSSLRSLAGKVQAASAIPPGLSRATLEQKNDVPANNKIRLELNNKMDGQWYRLTASLPPGYRVRSILRDDGLEIVNRGQDDRKTGGTLDENIVWYIEGDTLVFYDDPVMGYSVFLDPPGPNNSLLVEIAGTASNDYGGQLSAICWPYDGGTPANGFDHLGRNGDMGLGSDFDSMAGGKMALRFTAGTTQQYGNPGGIGTGTNGDFQETSRIYYLMNETPENQLESVIVIETYAPSGTPIPVTVTQKIIIRGNLKWFATIYYIHNAHGSTAATNLRFFQG